jgi:putative antitoxin of VapBC-like toxin-antitoxin system
MAIDEKLIEEARKVGSHKTKKDAVTAALSEYVAHRKRLEILSLFGTIDFDLRYKPSARRGGSGSFS